MFTQIVQYKSSYGFHEYENNPLLDNKKFIVNRIIY